MNITDSDSSDPPSLTTNDSESPAGAPTPQAPNASEIPHNPHPVPSQRGINGDRPFQPPTIVSHSLENAQGGLQPRNLMIGVGYYSPPPTQLRAIDIPPNGPPGAQQTLQQQHHALLGRPPSNPASPSVQQGQLLAHRQVSGVSATASTATTPETLAAELDQIPPPTLAKLKRKLGMAGKDLVTMTPEEKRQLVQLFRRGTTKPRPGPSTALPGQQQEPMYPPPPQASQFGQPMHPGPPMGPPNGTIVRQGQTQEMPSHGFQTVVVSNAMLPVGHSSTIPHISPMQHPMNPPVTQAGQGMVNPQMHQYRQYVQSFERPRNMPQRIMPATSTATMTVPPPSAIPTSTPTMSNHLRPPPPPGGNPNVRDLQAPMSSVNVTEFTDLVESVLMEESMNFERDFAAWFNPGPDDTHRP